MTAAEKQTFQMTDRQKLVYRSLADRSSGLAGLYHCALRVLATESGTDSLFLAAHALRETMNALPTTMDLPTLAEQGRLGDRVAALEPVWNTVLAGRCHQNGRWSGEIDEELRQLLEALHDFFKWRRESQPKRRDVATAVSRKADPSGMPLPAALEKKRAERWLELHGYFVRVAHCGGTTPTEFEGRLSDLEQVILEMLCRQPSEDFSVIDSILSEEEASGA